MKDIFSALYDYLRNDKKIESLVQDRIYPIILPQNAKLPAIVYSPVLANYDSALIEDTGYVREIVQFNCHAQTFKKSRELSRLIKSKLQNYSGDMNGFDIEAVFIKSDYITDSNTSLKYDIDEYMSTIEFEIHYNEDVKNK